MTGVPLPPATIQGVKRSQALLFGAIGGPKWESMPHHLKPEAGLLQLRKELGAFANLRPAVVFDELIDASTIKPAVLRGTDIMVVRELTGGIYFGNPRGISGEGPTAPGSTPRSTACVRSSASCAWLSSSRAAGARRCARWTRPTCWSPARALGARPRSSIGRQFPDVQLTHMYVDNAAMQLIRDPRQFDVVVTGNIFGDILSDEASQLTGSIGMLASASIGGPIGFFEPIHGSAPDIAGQGKANPLATIGTVALLLRHGLGLEAEAALVERAVRAVLADGLRTPDIAQGGGRLVGTREMGAAVVERLARL